MATFMDIGILADFSIVFVFLLIFAVVFAFLERMNVFGKEKKGMHGLIALAISFLIIISKQAVNMIHFLTPWFVVLFLFLFLILFSLKMFGMSDDDGLSLLKDQRFYPYLIVIFILILVGALANTFGQDLLETGTGEELDENGNPIIIDADSEDGSTKTTSFGTNVLNTVVHPKVLGMIAIMLVGLFMLIFLTKVA